MHRSTPCRPANIPGGRIGPRASLAPLPRSFAPLNPLPPGQHTGGSNCPVSSRPGSPSVLHLRADCGGRLFAAKLGVVVHYLPHQESISVSMTSSASSVSTLSEPACPIPCGPKGLFMWGVEVGITPGRMKRWRDRHPAHTLPRDPVSACLPPTPLHRCIGLRVRSLNDPHDARLRPFNRHTLEPAAASRCEPTHPSPSAS